MPIDFTIKEIGSDNKCNIEIQLNKKNDNKFKHIKSQKIEMNLDENNHAYFMINRVKRPKRLRIVFSDLKAPITISNLQFRGGKFYPNLNKFVSKDSELKINANFLTIYPNKDRVILDYTDSLKIRSAVKFDFKIFVIILVLIYLFAYKISNYIADFKSVQGKSRIEVIFLTIFFIFLFVPMSYIDQDEISLKENRTLAKWKPLISNNEINYNFGKDVNQWFNDRFNLRTTMVKIYANAKYFLSPDYYTVDNAFANRNTNWISLKPATQKISISQKEKEEIIYSLNILNKFCKQNNIKPYIIISPRKEEIYNDKLYPFIKISDNYKEKSKLISELKKETGIEIVYPFKELKELSKRDSAFFKTDHHWTDKGAFEGYKLVMEEIKKDFQNIYINNENDFDYILSEKVRVLPAMGFHNGQTYNILNLNDKSFFDTEYKYFKHKNEKNLKHNAFYVENKTLWIMDYQYNKTAPNMVLLGDSFTLNLLPSIVYSFNKSKVLYTYFSENENRFMVNKYKDDIIENKPQIFIICFNEPQRLKFSQRRIINAIFINDVCIFVFAYIAIALSCDKKRTAQSDLTYGKYSFLRLGGA